MRIYGLQPAKNNKIEWFRKHQHACVINYYVVKCLFPKYREGSASLSSCIYLPSPFDLPQDTSLSTVNQTEGEKKKKGILLGIMKFKPWKI